MDNIKTKQSRGKRLLQYIRKNRLIYLMMIPALGCWLLFKVGPLFGMVIAFQDYSPFKGILGSPFIGLENFMRIFKEPYMLTLIRNTVLLALYFGSKLGGIGGLLLAVPALTAIRTLYRVFVQRYEKN